MTIYDLQIGDKVMRRRSSDKQPEWVETTVNYDYWRLIRVCPEDYRLTDEDAGYDEEEALTISCFPSSTVQKLNANHIQKLWPKIVI